jgi:nucleotide-binding universal stress UspA family protein
MALGRLLANALESTPLGVHVLPHPDYMLGDDAGLMFERRAKRVASRVEEQLAPLGGRALTFHSHKVAEGLLETARQQRAAAIVLGCDSAGSLPGATTRSLLRHAECAVALAPPGYAGPGERAFTIAVASEPAGRQPALTLALRLQRTQPRAVVRGAPARAQGSARRPRPSRGRRGAFGRLNELVTGSAPDPDLAIAEISRWHRSLLWVPGVPGSKLLRRRRFPLVLLPAS